MKKDTPAYNEYTMYFIELLRANPGGAGDVAAIERAMNGMLEADRVKATAFFNWMMPEPSSLERKNREEVFIRLQKAYNGEIKTLTGAARSFCEDFGFELPKLR